MELEEERKSHKEREQRIKEQQMKIDNLSSLVCYSDLDRNSSQVRFLYVRMAIEEPKLCITIVFT